MLKRILSWLVVGVAIYPLSSEALINIPRFLPTVSVSNEVDIIVEADTYTPYFYKGRAEPTAGNTLFLVAVPKFNGANTGNFQYRWTVGGAMVQNNNQRISVSAGHGNELLVRVQVLQPDGRLIAEREEYVSISQPLIRFYEQNSLRGQSHNAVVDQHIVVGPEVTMRAEPYFIGKNESPPTLRTSWVVGGRPITGDLGNWREITIQNQPVASSSTRVDFSLQNNVSLLRATDSFVILYSL